jgi:outer membrane protein TolC
MQERRRIVAAFRLGTESVIFSLLLLSIVGCRMPGFDERKKDAAAFRGNMREETRAFFATNPAPLTLAYSLQLAQSRTLKLTQAQLDLQLSKIQRGTTFSAFLPQVEATFTRSGTDVPVAYSVLKQTVQLRSQYVSESSVTLTQPIFTPSAWMLFVESKNIVRSRDLVRARAGELLDVQVASLFYQAAVAESMLKTYERQREATQALVDRIVALTKEGYVLPAQRERAQARLLSDAYNVRLVRDQMALTRAKLFEVLRFWPTEQVALDGDSLLKVLDRAWVLTAEDGGEQRLSREQVKALSAEEWLWQTLVNRKELWAGDQMIVIRKAEVIRALTGFLPNVYGSVSGNFTSEVLQSPSQYWGTGLSAALSLFKGFQTVNAYREAKAQREAEFRTQEDRALALTVAAFEAYQNWSRVAQQCAVAAQARKAAEMDYAETKARFDQNQETLSDVLDKLAVMETARVQAVMAEYASALAEIVLRDAVGIGINATKRSEPTDASGRKGSAR